MLRLHCLMSEQDGTGLEQGGSDDASRQSKQSAQLGCCLARGSQTRRNVYQESTACRSIFPASASPSGRTIARAGYHHYDGILPFALRDQVCFVRTWSTPYMAALGAIAAYVRTGRACTHVCRETAKSLLYRLKIKPVIVVNDS